MNERDAFVGKVDAVFALDRPIDGYELAACALAIMDRWKLPVPWYQRLHIRAWGLWRRVARLVRWRK